MSLDAMVEFVNLPSKPEEFKVVQLFRRELPILLCGDFTKNHSAILEAYLTGNTIRFDRTASKRTTGKLVPEPTGDGYRVVGFGTAEIDPMNHFFQLPYGESFDYPLGANRDFNQLIKRTLQASGENWEF